jgi:hypothetical protein
MRHCGSGWLAILIAQLRRSNGQTKTQLHNNTAPRWRSAARRQSLKVSVLVLSCRPASPNSLTSMLSTGRRSLTRLLSVRDQTSKDT